MQYVDLSDFVADYDRREACQAVLRGDDPSDNDDLDIGGNDNDSDE